MFDRANAVEFLGAGLGTIAMAHQPPSVIDLMSGAGIGPGQLSGLTETEIGALVSEHGIDPADVAGGQQGGARECRAAW